jgi:hypothetical protein
MALTQKQKLKFYKNRSKIKKVVVGHVKKKGYTIFGGRSLNAHFPSFLDRPTQDYDILIPPGRKPKKVAGRIEKKLDKKFGGDFFFTEPAKHPGTFKVKQRLGKEGVVDVSASEKKIDSKKIGGVQYSTLALEKRNINRSLNDPESKFRHDKDRERLGRIKIFEQLKSTRKPKIAKVAGLVPRIPRLI